MLLKRTL
jgi:hypothetical protein